MSADRANAGPSEVDGLDLADPRLAAMARVFSRIPAHRRLYASSVLPILLDALDAARLVAVPCDRCEGSGMLPTRPIGMLPPGGQAVVPCWACNATGVTLPG